MKCSFIQDQRDNDQIYHTIDGHNSHKVGSEEEEGRRKEVQRRRRVRTSYLLPLDPPSLLKLVCDPCDKCPIIKHFDEVSEGGKRGDKLPQGSMILMASASTWRRLSLRESCSKSFPLAPSDVERGDCTFSLELGGGVFGALGFLGSVYSADARSG